MVTLTYLNEQEAARQFPLSVYLALLAFVGLIGNGIVCYIYANVYTNSNSRCFIRWLAAIDLLTCLIAVPVEIMLLQNQYEFNQPVTCKLSRFMNSLGTVSSSVILLLIGLDRYRKICQPLEWQISNKTAKILCFVAFLFSMAISTPNIVMYGVRTREVDLYPEKFNGTECSVDDQWKNHTLPLINNAISVCAFLAAAVVLIIMYSLIGRNVRFFAKKREERNSSSVVLESHSEAPSVVRRKLDELNNAHTSMSITDNGTTYGKRPEESMIQSAPSDKNDEPSRNATQGITKSTETIHLTLSDVTHDGNSTQEGNGENVVSCQRYVQEDESTSTPQPTNATHETNSGEIHVTNNTSVPKSENSSAYEAKPMCESNTITRRSDQRLSTMSRLKTRVSRAVSLRRGILRQRYPQSFKPKSPKSLAKNTTFLMFMISMVFILNFVPYLILSIIRELKKDFVDSLNDAERTTYRFFLRSYFANCAVNPIVYSIFDRRFRMACRQTFITLLSKLPCRNRYNT